MQVILRTDVDGLGKRGDIVDVADGHARNYLLPQGKATIATAGRVKELEHQKRVVADKLAKEMSDLEALKARLDGVELAFSAQAGEEGKLFGSVTSQQIAEQLGEKGFEVDRRKIQLAEANKSVGEHTVAIRLRGELAAEVKVTVTAAE